MNEYICIFVGEKGELRRSYPKTVGFVGVPGFRSYHSLTDSFLCVSVHGLLFMCVFVLLLFHTTHTQGSPEDATGHNYANKVLPAVFALIRKDYKYFYWPEFDYEQLFHIEQDPYEESDVLHHNRSRTTKTTRQALHLIKARYRFLKAWTQAGNPI